MVSAPSGPSATAGVAQVRAERYRQSMTPLSWRL